MFLIPSLCHMLNNVIKYKFYDFMYVKAANSCFVSTINLTSAITASCVIIVRNFSLKHNNQPDEVSVFLLPARRQHLPLGVPLLPSRVGDVRRQ